MVRLYSEYDNRDLAYVGGTKTKYVPIGDRVEVNVGQDQDITMVRRVIDRRISNVIARQYERRVNNTFVMDYDLIDYDETIVYEEEIVSGKSIDIELEVERRFDANVVLWSESKSPKDWHTDAAGAYVALHNAQRYLRSLVHRMGGPLPFEGKFVVATNRDLAKLIKSGELREDVYYRLCADRIQTVSLPDILGTRPAEMHYLVLYIARKVAGDWTADELLSRYASRVYARTKNYEETARLLDRDARTVKKMIHHT